MKNQRGFTLIELLVVIAIIGILSSVVLASLNSARQKGRDARRSSDLKQIQLALELYFDASGSVYPAATSSLVSTYISVWPQSPSQPGYGYASLMSNSSYVIAAQFEGTVPLGESTTTPTTAGQGPALACSSAQVYCVSP